MANTETVGVLRVLLEASAAQFESTLKSAEGKASGVSRSLARLTSSFSGQSLANEALKVAEAVSRVGGVTKLTEAELSRVRGTVDQVTAKFKLMGAELPPSISKLRGEIQALDGATGAAAKGGVSSLTGALGMVGRFLPALSAAGAIAGLTSLATKAFDTAGKITDLANKTGLSTDAIQRMQAVANQTGTTIDAFTNATFKLGVNVAQGTDKAREAVAALGLQYDQLKRQTPEAQFAAVVKALEGVDNQQERNRIGVALFGKQFSEIAASVEEGYSAIADAAAVSGDAQLRALDAAGDAWQKFKDDTGTAVTQVLGNIVLGVQGVTRGLEELGRVSAFDKLKLLGIAMQAGISPMQALIALSQTQAKRTEDVELKTEAAAKAQNNYTAALKAAREEVARLTPAQRAQIDAALRLGAATGELSDAVGVSEAALKVYQEQARESAKVTKDLAAEKEKAAKASEKFKESIRSLTSVMVPYAASVEDVGSALHDLASGTLQETAQETERARIETEAWTRANGGLAPSLQDSAHGADALGAAAASLAETLRADLLQTLQDIPQTLASAFTGGGDIMGAIDSIVSQVGKGLGKMAASAMGFVGPWGQAIGAAIGSLAPLVINAFDKLFGKGEQRKVNDLRDQFTSAAGGIDALAARAAAAGLTLERFYKAKSVKEYEAAIAELDAAFTRLDENRKKAGDLFDDIMAAGSSGIPAAYRPAIEKLIELGLLTDEQAAKLRALGDGAVVDVDKMSAAMDVLNGRVESLGPAFRQAQIDRTAKQYVNAIDTLIKGGGDVGGILFDAKEELSDLVNQSIKSGTVLPANMKPWIEELARAGLLVDENGEKITDISNIKYGAEMKTEAQIAEEGWNRIIAAIEKLVATLNGPLSSAINNLPAVPTGPAPAPADGGGTDPGFVGGTISRFGRFFNVFPKSGFPTKLHGTEAVITPDQAVPFAHSVLASGMPGLPSLADGALAAGPVGGSGLTGGTVNTTSTSQTTNLGVLVVQQGETMDPYRIADEVFRQLPGATAMDKHGLTTAFEQVIENYLRTYQHG